MLRLKTFTFNPFQENTYLLYDDEGRAIVIDPGNSDASENRQLKQFIGDKKLKPERLLLSHAHIDHIMGNRFIYDTYGLLPEVHRSDLFFLEKMKESAAMYGISCEPSPMPKNYLEE